MDTTRLLRFACEVAPPVEDSAQDTELLRRYATERDEVAFAELVRRNGPLVLRACRHVLGDAGAEDAFQATFLLLARSADRFTRPGSLAGWLHAAAVRIARRARRGEGRRRQRELGPTSPQLATDDQTWREVREVLDAELAALPEKYRVPLVLCYLQELSYEEAARQTGATVGVLRGRLERGKAQLRKRLAKHGLPLAAPVLVMGQPSPVSAALVEVTSVTIRTIMAGGQVPVAVTRLAGPQMSLGATLAPVVIGLAAVGAVLIGVGRPTAESAVADPPKPSAAQAAGQPALRTDVFGDPLPDGALARLGTTRGRAGIHSFGILPDGTVVTVGPTLDVRTFLPKSDTPDATVQLPLADPKPYLIPLVSPNGRIVAAGTKTQVVLWERAAAAPKQVATFAIMNAQVLALSPDGSQLAVAYEPVRWSFRVALCDVHTGAVRELPPVESVETLGFSGDGRRLLAAVSGGEVVWDANSGKLLASHKAIKPGDHACSLNHTGTIIAILPYQWGNDRVRYIDTITGQPVEGLTGPDVIGDQFVEFTPDGKTILIRGPNGVRWYDLASGKLIRQFLAPSSAYRSYASVEARFTPDGKVLVAHSEQALFRWDAATGKPLHPATQETGHTEAVRAVGISPDGGRVATLGQEDGLRVWDATSGRQLAVLPGRRMNQTNLDFSPDSKFLFAPSQNCDALVKWELTTGKEIARYSTGVAGPWGGSLVASRLAPDGRRIHAITRDAERENARIVEWLVDSGRVLDEKRLMSPNGLSIDQGCISPDGRWFAWMGLLFPVAIDPSANLREQALVASVGEVTFSWDSRLIARTTFLEPWKREARATVLEVATGATVCEMPVRWTTQFGFHPDGRSLAGAVPEGLVFWDLASGKEYARQKAPAPNVNDPFPFAGVVRYFPDGNKLLTGHVDTTSLIWAAPTRPKRIKALDDKERAAAWDDLLLPEGAKGWAAVWALADDPGAVAFLAGKVRPVEAMADKDFESLLADLGSDLFATREAATDKLLKAGDCAVGQLRAASKGDLKPEPKARVERLLAAWSNAAQCPPTGQRLRAIRAVAAVELAGTADARALLDELTKGVADATTTREAKLALERANRGRTAAR